MKVKKLNNYLRKSLKTRKYNNIVNALYVSNMFRKLSGISVFFLKVTPDNRIIRRFSLFGFMCFLLLNSLYSYCTYKAHVEDQTILRTLYNTKVKRYGDDFERVSSSLYVIFAMWKIPYRLNSNIEYIEIIANVDKALESLGENMDYGHHAYLALIMSIVQVLMFLLRLLSIWIAFGYLNMPMPVERMYQVTASDAVAFISTSHFCFFLIALRIRYAKVNKVLADIKNHKSWEYSLFVRGSTVANVQKAIGLQDRYIGEKIKACANIYGMLYKMSDATNKMFGNILLATMFVCMTYTILYMFYFMEATAAGLFHDVNRYIVFIIYVFWQIGYAVVIIFLSVYMCERAVYEAQNTSFVVHEIMNSDFSPSVTAEAMQLSIQILHQKPLFTASGLYDLNYALLHQLARSVSTYLIILLQFVTDAS